jgi:DNA-directed RNA polymerase specialized sigma24 family protein
LRLDEIDGPRWSLFAFGLLLLVAGTALPALSRGANAPLIAAGSAAAAAALILPRLQSIDFGGVLKGELRATSSADSEGGLSLRTDEWRLQRFAWLVCGDAQEARDLVEEVLAEARARKLPPGERGVFQLRSLVAMLENTRAYALLRAPRAKRGSRGSRPAETVEAVECRPTLEALAKLPIRVRVAYLLRCSWLLPIEQVAAILDCSPAEASGSVAEGRQALVALP